MRRFSLSILAVWALASPGSAQPAGGDDRFYPTPNAEEMKSAVTGIYSKRLKDPESARYEFGPLRKVACKTGFLGRGPTDYSWAMEFTENAKNSYGAYVGVQPYTAFLNKKGEISATAGRVGGAGVSYCHWVG